MAGRASRPAVCRPCFADRADHAGDRHDAGRQDHQLDAEDGDVDVPFFRDQRHRRLERLVAVVVIGRAAIDRHREHRHEEGGVDDRAHDGDQIEPLERKRPGPPDQRQRQQAEADIAANLPDHMEARMRRPFRIGGVGLVEVGDHRGEGPAGRHQSEQDAGQQNVIEGDAHDVSPSAAGGLAKSKMARGYRPNAAIFCR